MEESRSRERMLKKIRKALIHKSPARFPNLDFDSPVHVVSDEPLEIAFAEQFKKVNGHFFYCEDDASFSGQLMALISQQQWSRMHAVDQKVKNLLDGSGIAYRSDETGFLECQASITLCECLVARTGTVLMSSRQESGRRGPAYPDHHLVLAYMSQLVPDLRDGISFIRNRYGDKTPSLITAITGPSRTADIEKTLVQGAHGPKEIYVFLLEDGPAGS